MSTGLIIGLAVGGYVAGWIVSASILAAYWFRRFNERTLDGAAWGAFGGLFWPFVALLFAVALLVRKIGAAIA
jgi:hypothetical protein